MVKLAQIFFLLFSSFPPLISSSSMYMEAKPNIIPRPVVTMLVKFNPQPIKSHLPILMEPLPVLAGMGPALPLMDIEDNPTLAIMLLVLFLLLGLLLLLLLLLRYILPNNVISCVYQYNLRCCSRRAAYQEI